MEADFNYGEWAALATADPGAFERKRQDAISRYLGNSGGKRLLGEMLQREIDAEIKRAANPQMAFLAIRKMLFQQIDFLEEALRNLSEQLKPD